MNEFQLGKDVQEIMFRLSKIEDSLKEQQSKEKQKPCGCKSTQPQRVGKGAESTVIQMENLLDYKSAHWDRFDSGDCEITFTDLFVYANGDWRVNLRAHDNGVAFGDSFQMKISVRNEAGQEIERLIIVDRNFGAGVTDDSPRSGNSEQILRQYQDIKMDQVRACIGCNKDCTP